MNSEPVPSESSPTLPIAGATLQAVLQLNDGSMDSIAVPVPLPEVVLRVQEEAPLVSYFRRARSADSVVRYTEEVTSADGVSRRDAAPRQCGRCGAIRAVYYVAKLPPNEPVTSALTAYCETCYSRTSE